MSVHEILEFVRERSAMQEPTAIATLLAAWRSAPRAPGARFVSGTGPETAGSISAGCVEADLREHLAAVATGAPARIVRYGVSDEDAAAVGLSCGGEIEVLVLGHDPADPVWQQLEAAATAGQEVVLVTNLDDTALGRRILVTADGVRTGSLGDAELDREATAAAYEALRNRARPRRESVAPGVPVFIDPILRPRRLFAVGATPIALALARLGRLAGIDVTIVEPRETLARQASEAGVPTVHSQPAVAFEEARLSAGDAVAVLAHDDRLDVAALEAALCGGAGFVGLLGGRRTQRSRRTELRERGLADEDIAAIHGPIGLDIGAETPGEIGVSILAEVLGHWNRPVRRDA